MLTRLDFGNSVLARLEIHMVHRLQAVLNATEIRRPDHIPDAFYGSSKSTATKSRRQHFVDIDASVDETLVCLQAPLYLRTSWRYINTLLLLLFLFLFL